MLSQQKIPAATYDKLKVACSAKINLLMQRHNLTSTAIQKQTAAWVIAGEEPVAVTMQDLYIWRSCRSLPTTAKLKVLAKVLQCSPDELVPTRYQASGRGRRCVYEAPDPAPTNDIRTDVELLPLVPGFAKLNIRNAVLPADTAFKVRGQIERLHRIEEFRRMGYDDEQIKEMLTPKPSEPGPHELSQ